MDLANLRQNIGNKCFIVIRNTSSCIQKQKLSHATRRFFNCLLGVGYTDEKCPFVFDLTLIFLGRFTIF